jgi:hypothetical protein
MATRGAGAAGDASDWAARPKIARGVGGPAARFSPGPEGRRLRPRGGKSGKRRASPHRLRTRLIRRHPPPAPRNDCRRTASGLLHGRPAAAGFDRARHRSQARIAATRRRMNSTLRKRDRWPRRPRRAPSLGGAMRSPEPPAGGARAANAIDQIHTKPAAACSSPVPRTRASSCIARLVAGAFGCDLLERWVGRSAYARSNSCSFTTRSCSSRALLMRY